MERRKQLILDTVSDLSRDFTFYDRKEDEELELGAIEAAILQGVLSVDNIVEEFRECLNRDLQI